MVCRKINSSFTNFGCAGACVVCKWAVCGWGFKSVNKRVVANKMYIHLSVEV